MRKNTKFQKKAMPEFTVRPVYELAGKRRMLNPWYGVYAGSELIACTPRYPTHLLTDNTK